MTQLFIETPFRNAQLLDDLCRSCRRDTVIVVATGLSGPAERIVRLTAAEWLRRGLEIGREPAVFLLYRGTPQG
jgi:16S rRNA (cytidine1402-2'-O)-methyltransferase